jgi:hypothetical protein
VEDHALLRHEVQGCARRGDVGGGLPCRFAAFCCSCTTDVCMNNVASKNFLLGSYSWGRGWGRTQEEGVQRSSWTTTHYCGKKKRHEVRGGASRCGISGLPRCLVAICCS